MLNQLSDSLVKTEDGHTVLAQLLGRLNAMRRSRGEIGSVITNSCQHQLDCRVMEQGIEEQLLVGHRCQRAFCSITCHATMGSTS
jgi:hypothetical protein